MDWLENYKRQQANLDHKDQAAKSAGKLVGRYVTHPYADGEAIYEIKSVTKKTALIEVVEIGDAWVLPAWGRATSLPLVKIHEMLRRRDLMAQLYANASDWWARQPVGSTVHYSNGFNEFVRGVIVDDAGERKMVPTALIGAWKPNDIATRKADGEVMYGYHVKMIHNREPFKPHSSNMVEANLSKFVNNDPRNATPISLKAPEMTAAEIDLSVVATQYNALVDALKINQDNNKPEYVAAQMQAAIGRVRKLLG